MNIKVTRTLLWCLGGIMAGTAMAATQITLVNGSPAPRKPLEVIYKMAYKKTPESPTVMSKAKKIMLIDKAVIPVDLNDNALAGIVPISIGGHPLPPKVREFAVARQCSVAISPEKREAMMTISLFPHTATREVDQNAARIQKNTVA